VLLPQQVPPQQAPPQPVPVPPPQEGLLPEVQVPLEAPRQEAGSPRERPHYRRPDS
jgi:hypothetical protein